MYGDDVECVVDVVKRAMDLIDGSVLLGGRFGDGIITARVWEEVLESEGETAEWCKFLAILGRRPEVVDVLSAGSRGLVDALGSGGPRRLVNVVGKIEGASNSS